VKHLGCVITSQPFGGRGPAPDPAGGANSTPSDTEVVGKGAGYEPKFPSSQ